MYRPIANISLSLYLILNCFTNLNADNQTPTVSPVLPEDSLSFRVEVKAADFSLPQGLHSFVSALYDGKWLIFGGSLNGMLPSTLPPQPNRFVYVVDPLRKLIYSRSLLDPATGLTQNQIDTLCAVDAQFHQHGKILYMTGGIGLDASSGLMTTKDTLTAIDIPGLIHWVAVQSRGETLVDHIRQATSPNFGVSGGFLTRNKKNKTLLMFGESEGLYTGQIRKFQIHKKSQALKTSSYSVKADSPDYLRKDLNVVPIIHHVFGIPVPAYLALGGVYTSTGGAWTVPILADIDGKATMEDPLDSNTFKQAMNQFKCPSLALYSKNRKTMYVTLFGGISSGFFENGHLVTNPQLVFTNQITTISLDKQGQFKQFLLNSTFPFVPAEWINPGTPLLFGAGGTFIPTSDLPTYGNGVIKLDQLKKGPLLIGYIVGGIQSSSSNPQDYGNSSASRNIFKVYLKHFGKKKRTKYFRNENRDD